MNRKNSEELIADKRRQAVASLMGYAYQIWQTIHRWINLNEDEIIFLEGAEDFDVLGPEKTEAIQVKHAKGLKSFTLRSKEILEVISNFWEHQENNSESRIELHFLTTASRGREKYSPFGKDKGLDYWDLCKFTLTDTNPLKDFLKDQETFSSKLRQFIKDSDESEFRKNLIERIVWNTGNRPKEYLRDLIERNVCNHGNKLGIFPSESKKVISRLLEYVFEVICREKDRKLDYRDFLELFEKFTTQPVPGGLLKEINQLSKQKKLINHLLNSSGLSESKTEVLSGIEFQFLCPPLSKRIVRRKKNVSELSEDLEANSLLVLKGSTGMGKSVLARLLISENESEWQWLNLRGFEPNQIREILFREATFLSKKTGRTKLVIDNLNFGPHSNVYECALEGLLFTMLSSGGRVIITTQGEISNRIFLNLGIPSQSIYDVSPFSHEEIKEFAIEYGCPFGSKLKSWSALVLAKTRGHPQLVHAYIKNLNAKKWPSIKVNDITEEKDIVMVRREARHRLIDQLPSKEARNFVYKLSMIKFPFRRDHAIELGHNIYNLSNPGEIFDLLIGPWIERLNPNYFRLSPLLDRSAEDMYSSAQLKKFNKEIAEAFLLCRNLTLLEANIILLHGFLGSSSGPIMAMLSSLLRAPEEHWKKIAEEFWWVTAIGVEQGIKIFPSDPFVNNFLRLFQFRIAVEIDSVNLAPKIATLWENELDYGQKSKLKILDNIIFLIKTLICYEVPFTQKIVISRIAKLISFTKEFENTFKQSFKLDGTRLGRSLASSLFLFAIIRCRSSNDLDELLTSLENQSEEMRNEILSLLTIETDPSEILVNNVFLDELNSKSPQWDSLIVTLERAIELAISWKVESLSRASYRMIAVIQDEQQNKSTDALKTLKRAIKQLGYEHPFLGNERAIILYNQRHYEEALDLWEEALSKWPRNAVFSPIFNLPHVENCAAILGKWNKVKEIALFGEQLARKSEKLVMAVGFQAAYAFALWKIRDFQGAINSYAEVMDQIPLLPDPNENIHSYRLQKLVGHALAWMTQEASDRIQLVEHKPGWFSLQVDDEKIRELPLQPTGFMWYFLADLEYKVGSGNTYFERLKRESTNINLPFIYYMVEQIRVGRALKEFKFKSLVSGLKKWCKHYEISRKHTEADHGIFEKVVLSIKLADGELCSSFQHLLPRLLMAALIKLVNSGEYSTAPIKNWRANSVRSECWNNKLEKWFEFIENAPNVSTQELIAIMRSDDPDMRCLAAVNISAKELVKPSVRYYAELLIVNIMKNFPWIEAVDFDIEQIISRNWLEVTSRQSFALILPAVNSPLIIDACKDKSKGLKKAAKILLAAKNTVQISIPDQVMKDLRELAETRGRL